MKNVKENILYNGGNLPLILIKIPDFMKKYQIELSKERNNYVSK